MHLHRCTYVVEKILFFLFDVTGGRFLSCDCSPNQRRCPNKVSLFAERRNTAIVLSRLNI